MTVLDQAGQAARLYTLCRENTTASYKEYRNCLDEMKVAGAERDRLVRAALQGGHTLSQVAAVTGLTRQRVEQIKNADRK